MYISFHHLSSIGTVDLYLYSILVDYDIKTVTKRFFMEF